MKGSIELTQGSVCSFEEIAVYTKPGRCKQLKNGLTLTNDPKIRPLISDKMVPQNTLFSENRL